MAALSSSLLLAPLTITYNMQAPVVVSRRVAPIVCSAAVEIEPVADVKSGMAKQTFQRGSVHKVNQLLIDQPCRG